MDQLVQANNWVAWCLLAGATVLALAAVYVAYSGFRSPLRPWLIFTTAWAIAFRACIAAPRAVLMIGLVIGSGAALQLLFTTVHLADGGTLLLASIAWQAVMATAVAALAVYVHLYIIHDIFAERRFGAETSFYRGPLINQSLRPRRPPLWLLLWAGALGLAVWLATYGLQVATNVLAIFSPRYIRFAAPTFVQPLVYLVAMGVSFAITTLLSLMRPALSLGSRKPVLYGIATAMRRAPALFVVGGLLLIAPAIVGWLTVFVPNQFFGGSAGSRAGAAIGFLLFSLFQTLAVEAASVCFMNRAMNQSSGTDDPAPTESTVQAVQ